MFLSTELEEYLITEGEDYLITEGGSMRYQILNAVVDALETISIANGYNTDLKYVSTIFNVKHPEEIDKNKLPACFPYDDTESKAPLSIFDNGEIFDDMLATMQVIVTSVVFDRAADTALKRTNLIQDIEKCLVTDAGLLALLLEKPSPLSVETDRGYFGMYSVFDQTFQLQYVYNHLTGGSDMAIKTFKVGKVMIDAADLGEVTSASLTVTSDVGETTNIGDTWKLNMALGKSWTASVNVLYDPADAAQLALMTEFISGDCEIASVKFYEDAAKYYSGAVILTSCAVTKGINAVDTLAISFVGDGALSYT